MVCGRWPLVPRPPLSGCPSQGPPPLPSVSQSVRQGPRRTFLWPSDKTPSILLPLCPFCLLPTSHHSLLVLIRSPITWYKQQAFFDHHPCPLVLVLALACLPEATATAPAKQPAPSFVSTCGTQHSSQQLPATPPRAAGLSHSTPTVPRTGSRVLAAQLESPTQLHGAQSFPTLAFHVESRRQNCLPDPERSMPSLPTPPFPLSTVPVPLCSPLQALPQPDYECRPSLHLLTSLPPSLLLCISDYHSTTTTRPPDS